MLATENYGATRIGYSGNAESQRQYIFGWELQPEELFPDVLLCLLLIKFFSIVGTIMIQCVRTLSCLSKSNHYTTSRPSNCIACIAVSDIICKVLSWQPMVYRYRTSWWIFEGSALLIWMTLSRRLVSVSVSHTYSAHRVSSSWQSSHEYRSEEGFVMLMTQSKTAMGVL